MFDVTCLGILVADAVAKSVDNLPREGMLELVEQLQLHTGGCAVNAGIDLAKIGLNVAIIGKVGKDGFGNFINNELDHQNVCTTGLKVMEGISTSASLVMVNSKGERSFLHCYGSNAEFTEDDIDFALIEKSKILFVTGSLLMPKFDGEPTARILKKAQEKGVYTALDTAWDSTGKWMDLISPCLPNLDLFIPSVDEARMLSQKDDPEAMADLFLSKGVKLVVIKLGKPGCLIKNNHGETVKVPTYADIKPIDTNGAGDAFVAGFLTGIIQGWNLYQCGKFANAVGTHCVMELGASKGIKSMDEILEFMKNYSE
jgi:sugar/nucleoside kinase (ribokinase family)